MKKAKLINTCKVVFSSLVNKCTSAHARRTLHITILKPHLLVNIYNKRTARDEEKTYCVYCST